MGDPQSEVKADAVSIEGLDEVFSPFNFKKASEDSTRSVHDGPGPMQDGSGSVHEFRNSVPDGPGSVLETKEGSQDGSGPDLGAPTLIHPISVDEAAKHLGISTNAVCKRLRKGSLVGKKIQGKFKEEWLVEGAGLIEILNVEVASSVVDSPERIATAQSTVQDESEDSSDSVEADSSSVQDGPSSVQDSPGQPTLLLIELVEKQAAKLEAAAGQIGYLQAQLAAERASSEAKEQQIKLLTDSQHSKKGWWSRFCSWFKVQE
jgi:hypothetical protein